MQLRMISSARKANDFEGSLYRELCPSCGAEPLCWCRSKAGKRSAKPHPERRGANVPKVTRRVQLPIGG